MINADLHNDTAYKLYYVGKSLKNGNMHINLKKQFFSKNLLFFAVYMNPEKFGINLKTEKKYFEDIYYYFKKEIEKNSDEIEFFKNKETFLNGEKHNAVLTLEGGDLIKEASDVDYLKDFGVKAVNLTWNFSNRLASAHTAEVDSGLTDFGRDIIKLMEEKGILTDLSHSSDKTFFDVMKISKKSVLVSHSNSRELCCNSRNITDEMFLALIENGGLLGINFYIEILGENTSIKDILKHIGHFLRLGGENNIAFGSDFDGMDLLPDGIKDFSSYESLCKLLKKEFSDSIAEKIMYKNILRILK